jgi:tRNA G18 (ribose-2'-O)-methylase SpoU
VTGVDWSLALSDSQALREAGHFLAEGRLVLERILAGAAGGPDAIVEVLATPAAARALALESQLPDRLTVTSPAEMEALTGFNFHRGVLALVRRRATLTVDALLSTALLRHPPATRTSGGEGPDGRRPDDDGRCVLVVAEHLVDVDNVGSCFRNARAFGAAGVLLDERCPDPLYRKAVRTSLGHVLDVPWSQAPFAEILSVLHARDVTTVALTPGAGGRSQKPQDLRTLTAHLDPARPIAIVVGNEGSGLSVETMAGCTHLARIPMAEGADSLNVATALAVALYQFREGSGL